ncbi:MAG: response regulator, partial [Pseudomonadales bacterium]|nr:response regulator [Pseudomonadales bacterium]
IADVEFIKQHQIPASLLKGKKVLFVDDSTEFAHVVQEQAISWGMNASVAYYGDKALELMRAAATNNAPFDIVSLDMNMPGLSGMEIAHIMENDPNLRNAKRVLLTAMRVTPPKEDLQQANIKVAMQKPASARVIKECFLSILDDQEISEVKKAKEQYSNIISGKNILVAEDNAVNQMVIKNMLKKLGAKCVIANDGAIAVECFKNPGQHFDMILMDVEMPNMDGCDATIAIRKIENNESLDPAPILALTAHAMREHQELCEKAGMNGHLSKPLELDILRDKLCQYL